MIPTVRKTIKYYNCDVTVFDGQDEMIKHRLIPVFGITPDRRKQFITAIEKQLNDDQKIIDLAEPELIVEIREMPAEVFLDRSYRVTK